MKYRPEIDGLRAVAVWGVVLFHFGVPGLPGGALGVDVFFVISGYLITAILVNDIQQDRFSIRRFYERRARRILPALLPVLITCCIAAYLVLDKYNYHLFSNSVSYLAVFCSNFFFRNSTQGYFAAAAHDVPLLHTWSLSVEEQFYLLYPVVVFFTRKWWGEKKLRWVLLLLFCVSLAGYGVVFQSDRNNAFYNSLFRCWQLLAGGLLSCVGSVPVTKRTAVVSGIAGWALLLGCFVFFSPSSSYAFLFSIGAVAGAVCMIFASQQSANPVLQPLRSAPALFFGRISYSLYLWHWPIVVFVGLVSLDPPGTTVKIGAACVSIVLAAVSYRFIEQPFRRKKTSDGNDRKVLPVALTVLVLMGLGGLAMYHYDGLSQRSRIDRMQAEVEADLNWMKMGAYQSLFEKSKDSTLVFSIGDTAKPVGFILWGDSHARALASGIDSLNHTLDDQNLHGYVFPYPGVAPLLGVEVKKGGPEVNARVFNFISSHPEISTVVLAARWRAYYTRSVDTCKVIDKRILNDTLHNHAIVGKTIFQSSLRFTIERLLALHKKVVILTATPEIQYNFISLINHARFYNDDINAFGCTFSQFQSANRDLNTFLHSLQKNGVTVVDASAPLLSGNRFLVEKNGHLLYRDYNHLSRFGTFQVAKELQRVLYIQ